MSYMKPLNVFVIKYLVKGQGFTTSVETKEMVDRMTQRITAQGGEVVEVTER